MKPHEKKVWISENIGFQAKNKFHSKGSLEAKEAQYTVY